jgi:hypothetical protein
MCQHTITCAIKYFKPVYPYVLLAMNKILEAGTNMHKLKSETFASAFETEWLKFLLATHVSDRKLTKSFVNKRRFEEIC